MSVTGSVTETTSTEAASGGGALAGRRAALPWLSRLPLVSGAAATPFTLAGGQRELRLDLFRGLALWLIYIDHVSPDVLSWFTIRSYGFSDAAEIFIFISGFTAAFVYGRVMFDRGFVIGAARVLRRVWQIYTAHLLLFAVLIAEITIATAVSGGPAYIKEMAVGEFFRDPGWATAEALVLRFRPLNMDVLPLYVVLMVALPLVLRLAKWRADLPLLLSIALYVATIRYDLHFSTYPAGFWSFNPCAWQLLFVFGAWCALGGAQRIAPLLRTPTALWIAAGYLVFSFGVTLTWYFPPLEALMPSWLAAIIYPINKTDLDILRFGHFLALAVVTLRFVPGDWKGLDSPWLQPMILCGQYSLQIFALGVALSFAGYAVLTETAAGIGLHIVVGLAGIVIMSAVALVFTWYKRSLSVAARRARPPAVRPG